jgi:nicotinamide-nucleotide amidase
MPSQLPTDAELFELARQVGQRLLGLGARLVTAESCTGGWIAKAVTDIAGSSDWFECGYVTYSNAAKVRDLGVAPATLARDGAVSEATVREMAAGALRISGAQVAVAVSGIAGPDGGTAEKPVGTVWLCAGTQDHLVSLVERFPGDREAVRRLSVERALRLVMGVRP